MIVPGSANPLLFSADEGYNLTRSLRFRASATASLSRTPASATNRKTWTWSGWVKRGTLGTSQVLFSAGVLGSAYTAITIASGNEIQGDQIGSNSWYVYTNALFRDPAAWYHIVFVYNSTEATNTNRIKLYVNGVQQTLVAGTNYPALNGDSDVNNNVSHVIGKNAYYTATNLFDGYLTEVNFIDGQALTPSSFGSTNALTGVWQPARYTGTYGTNGFYLPFTDNSALTTSSNVGLGKDFSGNGNYFATNNISLTAGVTYDSMTDVPTLTSATAANFAVLNPVGNGSGTISNGNLRAVTSTTLPDVGNFAMQSGKWYWEVTLTTSSNPRVGMYDIGKALPTAVGMGGTNSWAIINGPSRLYYQGSIVAYGSFVGNSGSVVMIAYDPTNGNLWFGENGSWFASGNPATGANPSLTGVTGTAIVAAAASGSGSNTFDYNFGQRPFSYTPPTNFNAVNTFNLPTSTIVNGASCMAATLYTGTAATLSVSNAVNGVGFQPDFVWFKSRSSAYNHLAVDSVRGLNKYVYPNLTAAEGTFQVLDSVNNSGFVVNASIGTTANENGVTYVAWNWKAGQGSTSSNTNGTITSTVSVNASAGFSVVTYTGTGANATVGHGLGVAPQMVIIKGRGNADNWIVYNAYIATPTTHALILNSAIAPDNDPTYFNSTAPTSSVFSVGTDGSTNQNTIGFVAYCWTPIAGFSSFGKYTGNGSNDGPMIYTGFRPAVIMVKRTDTTGNWCMFDDKRLGYNGTSASKELYPNLSNAEGTSNGPDQLSNGFKLRDTYSDVNASGGTYIYACWAETPFKNSLAR